MIKFLLFVADRIWSVKLFYILIVFYLLFTVESFSNAFLGKAK